MKGLKRLLRINKDGHVIKQTTSEVAAPNDLENRMDNLNGTCTDHANRNFSNRTRWNNTTNTANIKRRSSPTKNQSKSSRNFARNCQLIRIREKHLEQTILNRLENEALERKKWRPFGKLFRSTQIEIEKKQYSATYIEEHYSKQLTQACMNTLNTWPNRTRANFD